VVTDTIWNRVTESHRLTGDPDVGTILSSAFTTPGFSTRTTATEETKPQQEGRRAEPPCRPGRWRDARLAQAGKQPDVPEKG
jgi:hypothetical protein